MTTDPLYPALDRELDERRKRQQQLTPLAFQLQGEALTRYRAMDLTDRKADQVLAVADTCFEAIQSGNDLTQEQADQLREVIA